MSSSESSADAFKGSMMLLLFLAAIVGSFSPSFLLKHKQALSLLNCFSGGVILSAALVVSGCSTPLYNTLSYLIN